MEWDKLVTFVNEVKEAANQIQCNNEKVQEICKKYFEQLGVELATPVECQKVKRVDEQLKEIKEDLERVLGKASDEVFIKFVGATSSGKSTLINALLKEERLPAGFAETTMCLIEICTTNEEQWRVTVNGIILPTKDENEIKKLLDAMSKDDLKEEREKLKINEYSVVRVDWPKKFSKVLPENVVLVDTPGFGEDDICDHVVTESCKAADIIVAVMDSMSPSKALVTKLVKEVNCQYAFGVFTKWDQIEEKQKEENSAISVDNLRKKNTEKYLNSVNSGNKRSTADDEKSLDSVNSGNKRSTADDENSLDSVNSGNKRSTAEDEKSLDSVNSGNKRCTAEDIFFVDSLHALRNREKEESSCGVLEFQQFEERLAKISKQKKGELLKREVEAVAEKVKKVYDKFKAIVEKRKEEKLDRLKETLDSLEGGDMEFITICQNFKSSIDRGIADISMNDLIKQFEEDINTGNLSEEDAFKKLRDTVNEEIKKTIPRETTNANKKFKKWEHDMAPVLPPRQSELSTTESEIRQLNDEELPNDRYNDWLDFHSYCTNNYLMGAVVTGALGAICGVGLVPIIGAEMLATGLAGGATAGGVSGMPLSWVSKRGFGFGIGDMIKKYFPISEKKMECWKKFLAEKWSEAGEDNKKLMNNKIDRIKEEKFCEVDRAKSEMEKEKNKLECTSHYLNEWSSELDSRREVVQNIRRKIDGLFCEYAEMPPLCLLTSQTTSWAEGTSL